MSNYKTKAKRPEGTEFETVDMYDDHYGKHHYGVRFPDGEIFPSEDCEFLSEPPQKCPDPECGKDNWFCECHKKVPQNELGMGNRPEPFSFTSKKRTEIRTSLTYCLPAGIKDFEWEVIINNVESLIEQAQAEERKKAQDTTVRDVYAFEAGQKDGRLEKVKEIKELAEKAEKICLKDKYGEICHCHYALKDILSKLGE